MGIAHILTIAGWAILILYIIFRKRLLDIFGSKTVIIVFLPTILFIISLILRHYKS